MERYYKLSTYLKDLFGERVYKIALDGGFTCPNRDGTVSTGGCIFCNGKGSGEHTRVGSIKAQVQEGIQVAKDGNKGNKYIAYFQSFTSTYAPIEVLKNRYREALLDDTVVGLAIATRPDCVSEEVADLIKEVAKDKLMWVELGLQTQNENTAKAINRGYGNEVYEKAVRILKERSIKVVTHLIVGLPNEKKEDFLESVRYVVKVGVDGLKLHSLYVEEGTKLSKLYKSGNYSPISREEYVQAVCEAISIIPPYVVIHRLTGDGEKTKLLAPLWTKEKKKNLNAITKYLKDNDIVQGCSYKKSN